MNPGKDYAAMIREQNKAARPLPLNMAWEFMPRPLGEVVTYESEALTILAQENRWQLPSSLRQLLKEPQWAIVVTDHQQIIQYVNQSFENMTGYNHVEAIGRRPVFLQGEATDPNTRHRIKHALDHEQVVREIVLNYHKDGTTYWCDLRIWPLWNEQKEVINYIALEQEILV